MEELLLAVVAALLVLVIAFIIYNYTQSDKVTVSKRLGSMAKESQNNKRARGDFWEDLKQSKVKEWAGKTAEVFKDRLPNEKTFSGMAERAGIPVTGGELLVLILGSTLMWFGFISVLLMSPVRGMALAFLWFVMCVFYVNYMGKQRMKDFDNQLGDAVVMMNNALRAGFTFQQAMDTVAKELPDPMSAEFSRALREVNLGVPLEDALNGISKRMQSDDFDLLATAVIIQRQIGGNLSQILDTIGTTIRDRVKLKLEIKVLTAEGVFAGWMIALLPFFVCAMVVSMNPNYFDEFLAQSYAKYIIIGCIISEIIGGLVIRNIITIKV